MRRKVVIGHDPHIEGEWFTPDCPDPNVTANYPPTMLIHGTADTDAPHSLSKDMDATLEKAGVVHEFITVDGASLGGREARGSIASSRARRRLRQRT